MTYVLRTVPNLEHFGGLGENVHTLCTEIGKVSQRGGRKETGSSPEVAVDHPVFNIPQGWVLETSRRAICFTENTFGENLPGR